MNCFIKSNIFIFFALIYFISIKTTNCITEKMVNSLKKSINEESINKEISDIKDIIKEYDDFNKKYNILLEKEKKRKEKKIYDEKKFREEYQQIYNEGKIFKDYFFKQRSKMSNFINKPKGKIAQNIIDVYHSTVEYSLECQDLLKDLEEKINVNKGDL